jgi:hypothetical protein
MLHEAILRALDTTTLGQFIQVLDEQAIVDGVRMVPIRGLLNGGRNVFGIVVIVIMGKCCYGISQLTTTEFLH